MHLTPFDRNGALRAFQCGRTPDSGTTPTRMDTLRYVTQPAAAQNEHSDGYRCRCRSCGNHPAFEDYEHFLLTGTCLGCQVERSGRRSRQLIASGSIESMLALVGRSGG